MSITLTTGKLVAINGVTQENDNIGAVTNFVVNFLDNTVTFFLATGSLVSGNINVGTYADNVYVVLNMGTGAWTSTNGKFGVLSGGVLTSVVSQVRLDRNLMETFSAGANAIMPGTQVPWA